MSTDNVGSTTLRASTSVMYGDPPTEPGMPMNVMAEATSHDMIAVSWESPADDGGSDITGYMVQSAYMMADDMMSDWMDVDPAHMGMDMMYMDMGLMAETTYYYRVSAINSVGMGDYSDGMAMAMTMAENMAPMAGDDVADQMVYVGAMVEVQSNFSDPDEDMPTWRPPATTRSPPPRWTTWAMVTSPTSKAWPRHHGDRHDRHHADHHGLRMTDDMAGDDVMVHHDPDDMLSYGVERRHDRHRQVDDMGMVTTRRRGRHGHHHGDRQRPDGHEPPCRPSWSPS